MRFQNPYVLILSLFGVFLVVTTLQLGKSRKTINLLEKQKETATQQIDHRSNQMASIQSTAPMRLKIETLNPSAIGLPKDTLAHHPAR